MNDFQSQLESLVNEAAEKYAQSVHRGERYVDYHNSMPETIEHFKACADLIMPVLMKAIKQRNLHIYAKASDHIKTSVNLDKELLDILKGKL